MPNHLVNGERLYIKLAFKNVSDLLAVRGPIIAAVEKRKTLDESLGRLGLAHRRTDATFSDPMQLIEDVREYDVPYHIRVAIDNDIRVGQWYKVHFSSGETRLELMENRLERAEPVVMAFDIETTKLPLKFPDKEVDNIMMISYMLDGQVSKHTYLIVASY